MVGIAKGMVEPGDSHISPSLGKRGVKHFYDDIPGPGELTQKTFQTTVKGIIARVIGKYQDGQNRIIYDIPSNIPLDDRVEAFMNHNQKVREGTDYQDHTKGHIEKG